MRKGLLLLTLSAMLMIVGAANAQDSIVDGLNNPRHVAYDGATGILYVAESGIGGDLAVQGSFGPATAGSTSQITVIDAEGEVTALTGFPSRNEGGEVIGASGVAAANGLLWVSVGQGTRGNPLTYSVIALNIAEEYRVVQTIDVWSAEVEYNPDGGELDSNPVDVAYNATTETVYIADAGCNCVWQWTAEAGITPFAAWSADLNPVSTSVEVALDGVYVSFLTGFPFPSGGSTVEKYDFDGVLVETFEGFTAVVDLLFANDTLYAVEFGQFGEQGWTPNSGRVVDVFSGSAYAEGLNLPYGIAMTDSELVVTVNAAYGEAGSGALVFLDGAGDMGSVTDPAATPEAGS
ncbi:MAG: ScyD/ScyE family protein [Chloroflexota bacterium]|nr:ScyD/ScyE family protein [Chloroflexota bacterium]